MMETTAQPARHPEQKASQIMAAYNMPLLWGYKARNILYRRGPAIQLKLLKSNYEDGENNHCYTYVWATFQHWRSTGIYD